MKIQTSQFYGELISLVQSQIKITEELKSKLNQKKSADSWCALECIKHLNSYSDFYLPEIKSRIKSSSNQPEDLFKSGTLGNSFVNLLKPKENLYKMKSPKQ